MFAAHTRPKASAAVETIAATLAPANPRTGEVSVGTASLARVFSGEEAAVRYLKQP